MFVLALAGLAVLYRYAPSRRPAKWRWISIGSIFAAAAWLGVSSLFSWYLSRFANYDATYGSLAAPVVLLLWFWLSALIVLIGAEIDAELEHSDSGEVRPPPEKSP